MDEDLPLNVIFAPDWRAGNSYQTHLGRALEDCGVRLRFLSGYRRVLPLARGANAFPHGGIFHLHWPEPYLGTPDQFFFRLRMWRFPRDLALATRRRTLFVTAHNIYPHNFQRTKLLQDVIGRMYRRADGIIVHSDAARHSLVEQFQISAEKMRVIPHGVFTELIEQRPTREAAREYLKLESERPLCLMFGAVSPYKGIEEVLDFWKTGRPECDLAIVGFPDTPAYAQSLSRRAEGAEVVHLRFEFVSNTELQHWLARADCCLFNYGQILTSGSVHPPRALGIPILLPKHLTSLDLAEPDDRVLRYESLEADFAETLQQALNVGTDFSSARRWREEHDWSTIGRRTFEFYLERLHHKR